MTPERWQQVEQLFDQALAQPPDARAAFVRAASAGDTALQQAVAGLLAADSAAADFLETPAVGAVAAAIVDTRQTPSNGERLGPYEVLKPLGAGGMGAVYLVRDTRLQRKVALKVLSPELAGNADYMRRFAREARALSGLNHPNIVTIHEIGEHNGQHFIVTEFVDGVTLRQRLAAGGLSLDEISDIARQTAQALAAAHEEGVIHRDIKPENIMLRRDGLVKVLDFGLAKQVRASRPAPASEVLTQPQFHTEAGTVLGTANYMSPEQARGQTLDARTDVWSWGVVAYEMLAGRAPFARPTTADTLAAVLQQDPEPLARCAPQTPAGLQRVAHRALQKDPAQRYADAQELLIALGAVADAATAAPATGAHARATRPLTVPTQIIDPQQITVALWRRWAWPLAGGMVAVLLLAFFFARSWRQPAPAQNSLPAPQTQTELSYSLTVQRHAFGKPLGKPFQATGQEIYGNGDEFWLSFTSPQTGYLYVINEGPRPRNGLPSYHVLFPLHRGSARLEAHQTLASPPRDEQGYHFDEQEGLEKIWLVFASEPVPVLERAKDAADTQSLGELTASSDIQAVQQFLAQHQAGGVTMRPDHTQERTVLETTRAPLIYLAQLKHK